MSDDETTVKSTLLQWASENLLSEATLSEDGSSLSLRGAVLKNIKLNIQHGDKSCQYSLASIYLQILDQDQGLMAYRNACKKYNCDPVKAVDKPAIVGFFLGASSSTAEVQQPESGVATAAASDTALADVPAAATAAGPEAVATVPTEDGAPDSAADVATNEADKSTHSDRKHRKDKDRHGQHRSHRHGKEKEKDHHKRKSSKHHHEQDKSSPPKKKKPKLVTNEQLFSNLSIVVDKRQLEQKAKEEITKALSAEGFHVTSELLSEHKEKTQAILSNEIPVGNSASILRATNTKKNLARVLELYLEVVNPPKHKLKPGSSSSSRPSSSGASTSKPVRTYLIGKKPVIIVPKGMTAPLTLMNAHEFFCNGRFIPREVMLKQGGRLQRSPATTFTRKVRVGLAGSTKFLEFEIMDNPKKLGNNLKDWERIVAVIVLGHSWQFKDWPAPYNNPVQLFSQTYGFFVSMEGDKIPNEIAGWAVKQAKLNRDKRGLDSVTHASFWNGLDEFMAVHRPELLPQQDV